MAKGKKMFGEMTPFAWVIEPTHGCNLRCWHCSCRKDPLPKTYGFMSVGTAVQAAEIFRAVNPTARLDLCGCGEPTMNPNLLEIVREVRRAMPDSQIQVTTNGTRLVSGDILLKDMLNAGANFIYVDMYSPRMEYINLAKKSGFDFYEYYNAPPGVLSPWTYHGDRSIKQIVLQENPTNWPKSRKNANLLGTFLNHLDWDAAAKYGVRPTLIPAYRRCNQPFVYTLVDAFGNYLICGQDGVGETSGQLGNVNSGLEGYKEFWFSPFMQMVRWNLRNKERSLNPHCCRCGVTFSKGDYIHWKNSKLDSWYRDGAWHVLTDTHREQYAEQVRLFKGTIGADGLPSVSWPGFVPGSVAGLEPGDVKNGRGLYQNLDDFCAFILSHGRPDKVFTYAALKTLGYTGRIIVLIDNEDKTADGYYKNFGDQVVMFDKAAIAETFDEGDNFGDRRTVIYARNACFDVAVNLGIKYFIELDDDYIFFRFKCDDKGRFNTRRKYPNLDRCFDSYLRFYKSIPALSIAMSQEGDYRGTGDTGDFAYLSMADTTKADHAGRLRKVMNSFFCSTERPFQFFGRINEDVNVYVNLASRGGLFLTVPFVAVHPKGTQENAGGMTEVYLDSGTYVKSFYTVMYSPSSVKIFLTWTRHRRLHHSIAWAHAVPMIIDERHKK